MTNKGRLVLVVRGEEKITIGPIDIKVAGVAGKNKFKLIIHADKELKIERPEHIRDYNE